MVYAVAFDAARTRTPLPATGLIPTLLLVGCAVTLFGCSRLSGRSTFVLFGRPRTVLLAVILLYLTIFDAVWALRRYNDVHAAKEALRTGRFETVEGTVTGFVPMPYEGHAMEHFSVGGRTFSYSDYVVTAGFHQSAAHGGPIRAGLQVRIAYVGDSILRLEIARDAANLPHDHH